MSQVLARRPALLLGIIVALMGLTIAVSAAVDRAGSAPAARAAKVVKNTVPLPNDGNVHAVTASCPKGAKATGGGVELGSPNEDFVQGSLPAGKRGWTAAGARSSPPTRTNPSTLTAHVVCLKL